jgi:hypothetical protein
MPEDKETAKTASRGSAHPVGGSGAENIYMPDPVRSTAASLVRALLLRAGVESNPGPGQGGRQPSLFTPADEREEIRRVETEMGRQLSPGELRFVQNQQARNNIMKIQVNLRSDEQKARLTTLQNNIKNYKEREMTECDPRLIIEKRPAKTGAQRMAVAQDKMSEEEVARDRERRRLRWAVAQAEMPEEEVARDRERRRLRKAAARAKRSEEEATRRTLP